MANRDLCPKVGTLGDRCTQERFHGGRHTFPPNPRKTPGVKPDTARELLEKPR